MIKQYLILGVLVLIAVFVLSSINLSDDPVADIESQGDSATMLAKEEVEDDLSNTDLRTNGALRLPSNGNGGQFDLGSPQFSSASSAPFSAATSSPFQSFGSPATPVSEAPEENDYSQLPQPSIESFQLDVPETPTNPKNITTGDTQNTRESEPTETTELARQETADVSQPAKGENEESGNDGDSDEKENDDKNGEEINSNIHISGHVLDDAGELIVGLPLTLKLSHATAEDTARFGSRTLNTKSNDKGVYAFLNLVEGDYRVCTVEANGYKPACQNPRAPHLAADFTLRATLNGRVEGMVKDSQGRPLSEVSISATPNQKNRALTDEKGRFNLPMTVNGNLTYQIYLSKKDYKRERIAVKGAEILKTKTLDAELMLARNSGFEVRGVVRDQSGNPVSGRMVTLHSPTVKVSNPLRGTSSKNGEFVIPFVEAAQDYRLNVNTRGGYTFDSKAYQNMEIYQGMSPLQIQLQKGGSGHFSARVVEQNGRPVSGQVFTLYSDSSPEGRATSDASGQIVYDNVSTKQGGSKLRIINSSKPRYTFSGITLLEGEYKSGIELVVDRGDYNLVVTVIDAQSRVPIKGAQGVLTWTFNNNGVLSQTSRSEGKKSIAGSGQINFSLLGGGEHQLRVNMDGFKPYVETIDINQGQQRIEAAMVKQ